MMVTLRSIADSTEGVRWSALPPGAVAPLWGRGWVDVDADGIVRITEIGLAMLDGAARGDSPEAGFGDRPAADEREP